MRFLAALAFLPATAFGAGTPVTTAVSSDAIFAADVLELRARGYRLAELSADWTDVTDEDGKLTLSIVMAKGDRAERFVVGFSSWGEQASSYERSKVRAPDERRHYTMEHELFNTLSSQGPFSFREGCGGDYTLSGPATAVTLMPNDYYVVVGRATGGAAQERLAAELASGVGAGLDLASIARDDGELTFVLADSEGEGTVLVAALDERGAVVAVEVRQVRQLYAWEGLSDGKGLARALRETGVLKTIRADPESGRIHLELGKKRRFTIDLERTFSRSGEWDHEGECGC